MSIKEPDRSSEGWGACGEPEEAGGARWAQRQLSFWGLGERRAGALHPLPCQGYCWEALALLGWQPVGWFKTILAKKPKTTGSLSSGTKCICKFMTLEFPTTLYPKFFASQAVPWIIFAEDELLIAPSLPRTAFKAGGLKESGITPAQGTLVHFIWFWARNGKA